VGRESTPFTRKTLSFLRSLKRNNNREWFRARRDQYDTHVHEPMVAVIERLAEDFRTFAPELIASPKQSMFRIYRDTRFSGDKKPLKTHAGAVFRTRQLPKPQGAGLYFEIAGGWVWIGGGMWRPEPFELVRIREHIAETWPKLRNLTRTAAFRRRFEELSGDAMSRVPRGYRADHPAAAFLKYRQFYGGAEFPASLAYSRDFYPTLIATFKALMPLVRFLNEPLVASATPFRQEDGHVAWHGDAAVGAGGWMRGAAARASDGFR
jgi:uncharacterized protein (TIGR02453 family)